MFGFYPQSQTNSFKLICTCRILSAGHGCSQVVGNNDRDVRLIVHRIQQSRHSGMGESGIPYHGNGRKQSCIGRSFGHRDGSSHIDTAAQCAERRKCPQRIATDISENLCIRIFCSHLIQGIIHIAVSASLAQGRWTGYHILCGCINLSTWQPQGPTHIVGSQFPRTR